MEHLRLIGRSFDFVYSTETYRIEFLDPDRLSWTQTIGTETGTTEEETYAFSHLAENLILVSWVEADGLALSHVINFTTQTITTHAAIGRTIYTNPGTLNGPH